MQNIDKAIISIHCHDDLGMAVGNFIAAIQAGARQVEGTLGIGERAGNTRAKEVIMAIKVRQDLLNVHTGIHHQEIYPCAQHGGRMTLYNMAIEMGAKAGLVVPDDTTYSYFAEPAIRAQGRRLAPSRPVLEIR